MKTLTLGLFLLLALSVLTTAPAPHARNTFPLTNAGSGCPLVSSQMFLACRASDKVG